ncbi:N-formylglutamate amidohydrolase [Legionella yabuuchiae]|uniref:N-formylglutamate amidohydrolase n=1 Tax=Legionella yabuuchiae TaxID=376727 RepID=UPI0010564CD5|nr:N-formylglutamate amidohydrolase [Legionella yabuuchiae]
MKPTVLVLSCEHGGHEVPEPYQHLFAGHEEILETHRAWDIGALGIANHLHSVFDCDCSNTTITRLLIDCNRSLTHPNCFSEFTKPLTKEQKKQIIETYYHPYRDQVTGTIQRHIDDGKQVLHLSIHTFTPELAGVTRKAAIALLYDSRRHGEKEVCRIWQNLMLKHAPPYRIRLNYPYTGSSDGFTAALRKKHSEHDYLGIEVECNQALVGDKDSIQALYSTLSDSLGQLLEII